MKINILSIAHKYPGQGVYSATEDHMYLLEKYSDYEIYQNKLFGKYDILHIHTINPKSFFSLLFHKKESFCVISAHIVPNSLKGSLKLNRFWLFLFRIYLWSFYKISDVVLAVSEETREELINDLKIEPEKIKVFRNIVRKDLFYTSQKDKESKKKSLRKKYGYSVNDFVVLGAGQIQPRKGIRDFFEMASELKEMKFIWVGGMPFQKMTDGYEEMNELINNAPSNLFFAGIVNREKMIDFYNMADIFFLPSLQETFGLVVLEAAGSGLPIVLRDLEVYKKIFNSCYLSGTSIQDFMLIFRKLKNDINFYKEYESKSYKLFDMYNEEKAFRELKKIYEEGVNSKK